MAASVIGALSSSGEGAGAGLRVGEEWEAHQGYTRLQGFLTYCPEFWVTEMGGGGEEV